MPTSSTLTASSCCKRGYWNAIAYGAAVLWASYVACWILYTAKWGDDDAISTFWPIMRTLSYIHAPGQPVADAFSNWLTPLFLSSGTAALGGIRYVNISQIIFNVIPTGLQWIVFLGALRLYWWRHRAPVTGYSALFAVFVMAVVIGIFPYVYHYFWLVKNFG